MFVVILYSSPAGSMLSLVFYSLMLMPFDAVRPLLPVCIELLPIMDRLNRILPSAAVMEEHELEWPVLG